MNLNVNSISNQGNQRSAEDIKLHVHERLLATLNLNEARLLPPDQLEAECSRQVEILLNEENHPLSGPEKKQLVREVLDDVFGLGPLEALMRDPKVSDILVNGCDTIYVERNGRLNRSDMRFRDDEQVIRVIQRIAAQVGRHIDESSPMLDARLKDGSRVNAIIPPLALDGPSLSIRRFGTISLTVDNMIDLDVFSPEMAEFLLTCVKCKMNILISGGTGSGKTTMLNLISQAIPADERVVTIEDAAELQLLREHVVRLETRPANVEGVGAVPVGALLINALRMRPDRIIIGECRGSEALDMLQAMNTGHEGSMTTVHANNPRDAFMRLENMVSLAGTNFPVTAIRQQISSALNILIQVSRMTGGRRRVTHISEVSHMEGEIILMQDLFRYRQTGITEDGHADGYFEACGVRPNILKQFESEGVHLPDHYFQHRALETAATYGEGAAHA
ncbi:MAG: CpaF family protein [Candidatus Hydrogenedentota bacterium]